MVDNFAEQVKMISDEFEFRLQQSINLQGSIYMKNQFGFDLTPEQYGNMVSTFWEHGVNPWEDELG